MAAPGGGRKHGSQSYWKAPSQTHSRNSQAFSSPSCGFHRTFGLGMWRERDSSASILVAHSNGQMIRAPWRPSGSRALMTFVQGVEYGLFPPVAFRQWGHARRVRSQRLCALSVRGRSSAPMPSKASLA
jgi:hypothetical protein